MRGGKNRAHGNHFSVDNKSRHPHNTAGRNHRHVGDILHRYGKTQIFGSGTGIFIKGVAIFAPGTQHLHAFDDAFTLSGNSRLLAFSAATAAALFLFFFLTKTKQCHDVPPYFMFLL